MLPLSSRSAPDSGLTVTLREKRESFSVRLSSVVLSGSVVVMTVARVLTSCTGARDLSVYGLLCAQVFHQSRLFRNEGAGGFPAIFIKYLGKGSVS